MSRATTLEAGGGAFVTNAGTALTHTGVIGGEGGLTKAGCGLLVLDAANSYACGSALNGGTVRIAEDAALGAGSGPLRFNGGTLQTTADIDMSRTTSLQVGGGTFAVLTGTTLAHSGNIAGPGALRKAGDRAMVLTGTGSYLGGTTVTAGTLQLGDGGTIGSVVGPIANDAAN